MSGMQRQPIAKGVMSRRWMVSTSLFSKPKASPPAEPTPLDTYVEKFRARTSRPEYLAKLKALPKTRPLDRP